MFRRRDFLHITVVSAAAAASSQLQACADPEDPAALFPQGIASGDPRATSIVLWTRVEPRDGANDEVYFEVSEDEQFRRVVASGYADATLATDHTCRIKVTKLKPGTRYWYRFSARRTLSPVGRTMTAPADDSDAQVRFAFATCQDYVGRYFLPWRILAEEPAVDFVLFLGDYFYETTRTPGARTPTRARNVSLPDGMALGPNAGDGRAAITLADYRSLYRTYRTDPDLQRAHALLPFIPIWDDHEFGNDCWQDRMNHFDGKQGDEVHRDARFDAQWTEVRAQSFAYGWFDHSRKLHLFVPPSRKSLTRVFLESEGQRFVVAAEERTGRHLIFIKAATGAVRSAQRHVVLSSPVGESERS